MPWLHRREARTLRRCRAQWLLADEKPIDGNGIDPDEPVEGGEEDGGQDPVLRRALELLAGELEEAA